MTVNNTGLVFGGVKNVLKLIVGYGCMPLNIHRLTELYILNSELYDICIISQ